MISTKLIISTFIIVGLMTANAALSDDARLRGQTLTTSYSGPDGSRKSTIEQIVKENDAIYSVKFGEQANDPCYLEVYFRDVATGSVTTKSYDKCHAKEGDLETLTMPDGAFVTGARVCLNKDRDKIKGVQLLGNYGGCVLGAESTYVEPAGCSSVVNISGVEYRLCNDDQPAFITRSCQNEIESEYFERANCVGKKSDGPDSDWEKTVKCPQGQVATGLKLNTREGGGDRRMYNGLALVCHELVGGN